MPSPPPPPPRENYEDVEETPEAITPVIRDTPAGQRAKERWQAIYDAGSGCENMVWYWMQVAYECLLDKEEAADG